MNPRQTTLPSQQVNLPSPALPSQQVNLPSIPSQHMNPRQTYSHHQPMRPQVPINPRPIQPLSGPTQPNTQQTQTTSHMGHQIVLKHYTNTWLFTTYESTTNKQSSSANETPSTNKSPTNTTTFRTNTAEYPTNANNKPHGTPNSFKQYTNTWLFSRSTELLVLSSHYCKYYR